MKAERRPERRPGAAETCGGVVDIVPNAGPPLTEAEIVARSARAVAGAYAVLVWTPQGRYSRRVFLTLAAADAAVDRARQRGATASVVLVELTPVQGAPVMVFGGEDR